MTTSNGSCQERLGNKISPRFLQECSMLFSRGSRQRAGSNDETSRSYRGVPYGRTIEAQQASRLQDKHTEPVDLSIKLQTTIQVNYKVNPISLLCCPILAICLLHARHQFVKDLIHIIKHKRVVAVHLVEFGVGNEVLQPLRRCHGNARVLRSIPERHRDRNITVCIDSALLHTVGFGRTSIEWAQSLLVIEACTRPKASHCILKPPPDIGFVFVSKARQERFDPTQLEYIKAKHSKG
mmetsp:Transcript_20461/g.47352  ORF Transcript_20461/g.47352 Transcript_20461/m.47352 type:complete len:238 (+) Transcript_20461:342-1055(+)